MPDLRGLLISIGIGAALAAYTILWWRWSVPAGLGVGVLLGGLALMTSVSFGHDPAEADAAWGEAAADLEEPRPGPRPGSEAAGPLDVDGDPT